MCEDFENDVFFVRSAYHKKTKKLLSLEETNYYDVAKAKSPWKADGPLCSPRSVISVITFLFV